MTRPPAPALVLASVAVGAASMAGCGDRTGPGVEAMSADSAQVTVRLERPGPRVPADFLGLGFEMPVVRDPRLAGDPALVRLVQNLGPGVLRFGGNSVERTGWSPSGGSGAPGELVLTPADFDRVFGFARRVGWRVIMDLRLARFAPDTSAGEAAALAAQGGDGLLAVEIGNEPDFFRENGLRGPGWNSDSLRAEFGAYAGAINGRAPGVLIAGPATFCTADGPAWFEALVAGERRLGLATHHFYPLSASAGTFSAERATIANMLSPELMARTRDCLAPLVQAAAARGIPFRLDETNSASGFGEPGVSDVLASALWAVDHLLTLADLGAAGVNVQTGTNLEGGLTCAGVYLPFCGDAATGYTARPLYYALLLVHAAARGRMVPADVAAGSNVVAHAALDDDGTLRVALVNKESGRSVAVHVTSAGSYAAADVLRLTGESLDRGDGVAFGGAGVAGDGTWAAGAAEPVARAASGFDLTLPPASAALVTLRLGVLARRL
ncbi:MAG TPA: hypothetical protein VFK09_09915 [Gemmatimonadales bacterium]|nr:hypothetical protein [Gemmatimonadales bacterium]